MDYKNYLKSNHWKEVKRRFYNSKLPKKCYVCRSRNNLNLHHKTYKSIGEENLNHLLVLCQKHHYLAHEYLKFAKNAGFAKVNLGNVTRRYKKFIRQNKLPTQIKRLRDSKKGIY